MVQKELPRNRIVKVCKDGCSQYNLSGHYTTVLVCGSRNLVKYMQNLHIDVYSTDVGIAFREYIHTQRSKKYADEICRSVDLLNAYIQSENFIFQKPRYTRSYPGEFGPIVKQFLEYLKEEQRRRPSTLNFYGYTLNMFCVRMNISMIGIKSLNLENILDFITTVQNMKLGVVQCVKTFLQYCQKTNLIHQDLHLDYIKPYKYKNEKLPSYYTKEEVLMIEKQIDRSNIIGKRDYAMMLLASRLGLRSSDIRNLQFSNLDWDKNEISIIQEKTNNIVLLPLLEDVGSAIIDYIINARPKTKDKNIFVSFRPPYHVITAATFSGMVAKYMFKSGIDCKNKHYGSHALRHSLATNLLQENVSLPVISSILGHSSTETTKSYLSVDLKSLLYCSHDVPEVSDNFYEQEGGVFYD